MKVDLRDLGEKERCDEKRLVVEEKRLVVEEKKGERGQGGCTLFK